MEKIMQDFVETNIVTRRSVLDARLTSRGLVLTRTTSVESGAGGARVSGLFGSTYGAMTGATTRDSGATRSVPNATIGALLAGSAVATYFLSPYIWISAGLMAGAIYLLAFREKDTIDF